MIDDFSILAKRLTKKADFAEVARRSLEEILGETSALIIIHDMEESRTINKPEVFEKKLKKLFGPGADLILGQILNNLEKLSQEKNKSTPNNGKHN